MHFEEALAEVKLDTKQLQPQRYIASNRFKVRNKQGPKFEQRWATRTSRLAELPGFRWFSLLRRIENAETDYKTEGAFGNYISLTVWEDKTAFDAWRTGEAFKEAHGGGSFADFLKLLGTGLFILDGAPKPAFYAGVLPATSTVNSPIGTVTGGWRSDVQADGVQHIPAESYVSMTRFQLKPGTAPDFEQRWQQAADGAMIGAAASGFKFSTVLRRESPQPDDGFNYVAMSVWDSKDSCEDWKDSSMGFGFGRAPQGTEDMLAAEPKLALYEGVLVMSSDQGP